MEAKKVQRHEAENICYFLQFEILSKTLKLLQVSKCSYPVVNRGDAEKEIQLLTVNLGGEHGRS
eukprot:753101-Hanusia_phi.AAC.2